MSSKSFDRALSFVLRWEGGYSNHPADIGGETSSGITSAVYDAYRRSIGLPARSVRSLESSELHEIYRRNYWDPSGCNLLPSRLVLCHFDWAVNAGVGRAVKTLQQVVGTAADGAIGPNTHAAIAKSLKARGEPSLCSTYCIIREDCYRRWGTGSQAVFLTGWLNRLRSLRAEIV